MPKKPKILYIDDQQENLRIRTMLLQQFGCETVAVPDGPSALRAIKEDSIDAAVIDYQLGGDENGEDVAHGLRVLRPDLPLIMLTGDSSLPPSARDSVDAVLIKGTSNPGVLLDLIQQLVPDATLRPRRPMLVPDPSAKAS